MTNRLLGRWTILLAAMLAAAPASALLRVSAERIGDHRVDVREISLTLSWPASQSDGELELRASVIRIQDPKLILEGVRWRCRLQETELGWQCRGPLTARDIPKSELALELLDDRVAFNLSQAKAKLSLSSELQDGAPLSVVAQRLPVSWLQPLLAGVWKDAKLTSGRLDGDLSVRSSATATRVQGQIGAADLGLDTADGSIAAAGLGMAGKIDLQLATATSIALDLKLSGGELLAGAFYAELPPTAVDVTLDATNADSASNGSKSSGTDSWLIRSATWRDSKVVDLSAKARLDLSADAPLAEASIRLQSEDLSTLTSRYGQSLLAAAGLPSASASGGLTADIELAEGSARRVKLQWQQADVDSGDQRVALSGLDGDLAFSASSTAEPSKLQWRGARLYGVDLGAAALAANSVDSRVSLSEPLVLSAFGGEIRLQRLGWSPGLSAQTPDAAPDKSNRLQLALQLERLDLAAISKAFDWPAFTGTLSGSVPSATYANDTLLLDGGLSASVFGGSISVDNLSVERPLGVAPTMTASIALTELDLQPLTAVFGFGEIEGRLNGRIDALRMVDWTPAAFDARFETVDRKGVRRRISQRAVNDLSSVGGGPVAGLQAQLLGVFDSFGYRRIGLGCRLSNNVCEMSGIEGLSGSSGSGYTVVEGSGLPSITVNGFQRRVDWPVLVSRLKAISEGQAPRID